MKAEHRKELETNILADSMGRVVQRMKERPQKRTVLWVIGGAVILLAVFVVYRYRQMGREEAALSWVQLAQLRSLEPLFQMSGLDPKTFRKTPAGPDLTNAGKTARFQLAWYFLWTQGIMKLGADSNGALGSLGNAEVMYMALAQECSEDPMWESEALYGLAIIEETRAIVDSKHLDTAKTRFEALAEKHPKTGYGKLAKERATYIASNRDEVRNFYQDLQSKFRVILPKTDDLILPGSKKK